MRPIASPIRISVTATKSAARRMYSPIAVGAILTDRAITRSLAPHAYFGRRTSRTFRIETLGGHRVSFPENRKEVRASSNSRQRSPPSPFQQGGRIASENGGLSIGMGGRLPSEWVAALPRFRGVIGGIGVDDWAWPTRTRTVDCAAFRRRLLSLMRHVLPYSALTEDPRPSSRPCSVSRRNNSAALA